MTSFMCRLPLFAALAFVTLGFAPTLDASTATPSQGRPTIAEGPLEPEAHYADITALVRDVIARLHYAPPEFDAGLSARAFDRYLALLDPNRSYFLASDIEEFQQHRERLLDRRRGSDLQPAYDIYNRFHQRVGERVSYLLEQLDREPDFTVQEAYRYNRAEAPWAADENELNEITRQRFKNDALTLVLAGQDWAQVADTLGRRYRGLARRADQSVASDVFQVYMNAFTTSIDPHTSYMTPTTQDNFRIDMSLSLEGIGAVLTSEDDYTRVVSIVPAGPADQGKELFVNDRIIAIAQGTDGEFVDVVGWRVDDVVQLVRGPRDTTVRLMVLPSDAPPDAAPRVVSIQRKKIRLEEQAARSTIQEVERDGRTQRIGIIDLPTFYADFAALQAGDPDAKSTTRDVARLLREFNQQGIDAVIMDLRGNGGGSLVEATDLAALFLGEGPVVQIRSGDGTTQVSRNRDSEALYHGPLAVLIDRRSASGSEIFAGVIQDYDRGLIVGDRSFGKGTVQQLIPLDRFTRGNGPRLGELKLTVAKFYRVSGGSNQHRGIVPDIMLPSPYGEGGFGESERPSAMPWDEINPTRYASRGFIANLVDALADQHHARVEGDVAFALLQEEFAAVSSARERTTVSLHIDERRRENELLDNQRLARENTRRALRGDEPVASLSEVDAADERDDVLLNASTQIVADLAVAVRRSEVVRAVPQSGTGGAR